MFRNNITINENPNQLVDGATVQEMLQPIIVLHDGNEAIGMPWEMKYIHYQTYQNTQSGIWIKSKQGELNGYRSSVALIPEYKIGIFNVALQSEVYDSTVWTYTILNNMLLPFLDSTINEYDKPIYTLPNDYELLIGNYNGNITLYVDNDGHGNGDSIILQINVIDKYRLFTIANANQNNEIVENILRLESVNYNNITCRNLDDDNDQEFVYFQFAHGDKLHATSLILRSVLYNYLY